MKRSAALQRRTPLSRSSSLHPRAANETNDTKDRIQALVRAIVALRDGGCILRNRASEGLPQCNGYRKDGKLILQADHLITRANAATYSDTRLIVCVCKGHHGWKNYNKEAYDQAVRYMLSMDRLILWDRAHADRYTPHRKYTYDWRLDEAALKQELTELSHQYPERLELL
jgi:hypothetical protein